MLPNASLCLPGGRKRGGKGRSGGPRFVTSAEEIALRTQREGGDASDDDEIDLDADESMFAMDAMRSEAAKAAAILEADKLQKKSKPIIKTNNPNRQKAGKNLKISDVSTDDEPRELSRKERCGSSLHLMAGAHACIVQGGNRGTES